MNTTAFLAYLDGRQVRWKLVLDRCAKAADQDPRAQLVAVFDALGEWAHAPCDGLRSNAFVNAQAVLAEDGGVVRTAAARHKRALRGRLAALAGEAGAADPGLLADQLLLIFEGAVLAHALDSVAEPVEKARHTACRLIAAATTRTPGVRGATGRGAEGPGF
ncbi:TetR/AcrR family transcriptional regulator [Streptomyces nitrosporeus]|uniref:TetR/AcrR family transcriptional regulator n=1 Tax=Streptomyces nitrosporeus TaxID=28894 RepID=A0A5J6FGP1_9ACTN|nr:TetR/AcrR family transcriptional regulator [Streptomyces nitrosporeus]QEU75558.1 TetR/AcrR family transcriptional regulator [Streptomyces nitrosporeus]GGZ29659.1 hypothetical protein GCM10010327_69920 [Streptomyces nitrosporeus]